MGKASEVQVPRRSERVPKEVAILLIGNDAQGTAFMEETKTVVLSRHGAGIVSTRKLAAEQEMVIVRSESNKEAAVRVVGQTGAEGNAYTYGVAFLEPDIDFWGIEFPLASEAETSDQRCVLECRTCGRREVADSGELESGICARNGLVRYCRRCGSSTSWNFSSREVLDETSAPTPALEPSSSREPFKNRRRHVRAKVNFSAFVRANGWDDVASCENVSRGGLCFRSDRRYFRDANIEVAAPFSAGSPCILVPAQIVYVQEMPEDKTFRYGAQYLPLTKKFSHGATAGSV